jgi:hypothetical protein
MVLVAAAVVPAGAQSFWFDHSRGNSISLEILKLDLNQLEADFSFTSAAFSLNTKIRFGENTWFVGELPFAHIDLDTEIGDYPAEFAFGNPYLGIRNTFNDGKSAVDFGIRPPIAGKDDPRATFYGQFSDVDRFGAFWPDLFTAKMHLEYLMNQENGLFLRGRVGPTIIIFTEDTGGDDLELLVHVGGQIGVQREKIRAWAGANSVSVITEESFIGDDPIVLEIAFGANVKFGQVEPGAFIRLPIITDYKDFVSSVFGLNVTVNME